MPRESLVAATWVTACLVSAQAAIGPEVDFQRDVRPILSDTCFACHGPDANARQANLRLDTRDAAFADRGGYRVIVPGNPDASRLYQRMSHPEAIARMPPAGAERHPTPAQVETIRRWIEQGAEWRSHWAYEAPRRPVPPAIPDGASAHNEIDSFVLARLHAEGLRQSPEVDKRTLLRRLTLDLTGLPPDPGDVMAFLADDGPDAYEEQVDRLLGSPHYGERMAMQWLDLARYADTHGFHIDGRRDMWHWRDWVIRSFNTNQPFDAFTIEQIAGDLLPEPTRDQKIATGFNRNHMINHEGGAIPAEYHTEYVVDRVETVATVWMAMTIGCARCHDHKYDPIKQREFYEFYAFFNSVDERGLDGSNGNAVPMLHLPEPSQQEKLDKLDEAIRSIRANLPDERIRRELERWEQSALDTIPRASRAGLEAHYEMEGGFSDSSGNYRPGRVLRGEPLFRSSKAGQGASFDVDTHIAFPATRDFDLSRPFSVAFWMLHLGEVQKGILHKMDGPASQRGLALSLSPEVPIPDELRSEYELIVRLSSSPEHAIVVKPAEPLLTFHRRDDTVHIVISYDGSGSGEGIRFHINGRAVASTLLQDSLRGSPNSDAPFEIGAGRFGRRYSGILDDLRIYSRVLQAEDIDAIYQHEPVRSALGAPYIDCREALARAPEVPEDDIYAPKPDAKVLRCRSRSARLQEYYLTHAATATDRRLYPSTCKTDRESARRFRKPFRTSWSCESYPSRAQPSCWTVGTTATARRRSRPPHRRGFRPCQPGPRATASASHSGW